MSLQKKLALVISSLVFGAFGSATQPKVNYEKELL
jgi:hypothetical protein